MIYYNRKRTLLKEGNLEENMEIKLDENFEIDIIDMGENGEGIGKVDGFTIFVDGGIVGDKVRVKLIKKEKALWYG